MKSMIKILSRYVLSAAAIALILLIVNFSLLAVWVIQAGKYEQRGYSTGQLANSLTESHGVYTLAESAEREIEKQYQWAMLLDDSGQVIWSKNLPGDVPLKYSAPDIASFSRWYLNDYPVYVWRHSDGLFVLGCAKGSRWKHSIEMYYEEMENTLIWFPALLALNGLAAILLALLFAMRLFRALKPLAKGIEEMAEKQTVELSTRGLLGDLAVAINKTSARLITQEAALNRRDNARTTWIAGVSHDIRTPLSLVMGYASQLEDDPELPPAKREQAGIIRRQSERIKTLVSDLNLASKLEYDMQPIRQNSLVPAVLLREVVADFLNSGLDDRYTVDVEIAENAQNALIIGDEELLRRAVSNLITNSIRHNSNGCAINITLEKGLGNCILRIFDNGTGFPQTVLEDLNQAQDTAGLQNHGLGLTIVRQIVKAHEGSTKFHNLPEGSCEVIISLPAK
jgi:signal transduction histidine kinase